MFKNFRRWFMPLWITLFVVRALMLCIGLDRLPMVPTVADEVFVNDPALALSLGHDLTAFSLTHSRLGLDQVFANYPPVFIFLQSLVFRMFGFSAVTLRASGVACDLAGGLVFLLILRELRERGIVDDLASGFSGAVFLLQPTTLAHAREARMESLVLLLGSVAFYLALRASRASNYSTHLWIGSATMMGLALATHLAAIVTCVALCGWSILHFRQIGMRRWLVVNIWPLVVLGTVWIATYGEKAREAFRQTQQIASSLPPHSRFGLILKIGVPDSISGAEIAQLLPLVLAVFVLTAGAYRLFSTARTRQDGSGEWRASLVCLWCIVFTQVALIEFALPSSGGTNRQVLTVPMGLVCLAVAASHSVKASRKHIAGTFLLICALQIFAVSIYMGQLRNHWRDRSAERFDKAVGDIPAGASVVAVPELWFAFRSHNRSLTVNSSENGYWSESPGAFDPYDVVILDQENSDAQLREKARIGRPIERLIRTYPDRVFILFARPGLK